MKGEEIIVVTDCEAGWDCVEGVFTTLKDAVEHFGLEYVPELSIHSYEVPKRIIIFHKCTIK